jgi:hypothetical protein
MYRTGFLRLRMMTTTMPSPSTEAGSSHFGGGNIFEMCTPTTRGPDSRGPFSSPSFPSTRTYPVRRSRAARFVE